MNTLIRFALAFIIALAVEVLMAALVVVYHLSDFTAGGVVGATYVYAFLMLPNFGTQKNLT